MRPVILDLDTGIDDSMALALSVIDEHIELLGVTTTYGNVSTEVSCANSRFMLDLFGAPHIPVIKGYEHAMTTTAFQRDVVSARIHGEDGLGDIGLEVPPYEDNGIGYDQFMLEMIETYGKELTIITTGPMTNIAMLLQQHPEVKEHIGSIVSMGGAVMFPGNITPYAEANIHKDPEATRLVAQSGVPFTLVGLDVTTKSFMTREHTSQWIATGKDSAVILARMVEYYMSQHMKPEECFLHDPSAVMYVIDPGLFTTVKRNITVVTEGESRGRTIGDMERRREKSPLNRLCLDVDHLRLSEYIHDQYMRFFS